MDITEQDIFKIIGLEVSEEERLDIESGLYHAAVIEFLDNYLEKCIGPQKFKELSDKVSQGNLEFDALNKLIQEYVAGCDKTMDQELKQPLNVVYTEFIQDQIDMLQQSVDSMESNDTKIIKQSLLKTLRDMFTNKEWDQMGDVFKRADLYKMV